MKSSATAGYIVEDLRGAERTSVSIEAKSFVQDVDREIDCEILDISETGAMIELNDVHFLPSKFKLFLPETHSLNKCRIVWKIGSRIGVAFENKLGLK